MKKLSVYLKGYIKESILGPLLNFWKHQFELLVPIVIKSIVDTGIGRADKVYIIKMCLLLILLGVVGMVCSVTASIFPPKLQWDL